ncbi:hypothetical protein [Kitasatospora mediocidica]|uniref:hypothetical protein n=1 Tax=Kitasatospora mediocidica TaxID=58352 RepID=UPI0006893F8A|nr:hypothetical protein [Kitasatospora mediocidica]
MTTKHRLSVGTQSPLMSVLSRLRILHHTAERDAADHAAGHTIEMMCLTTTIGGEKRISIGKGNTIARLRNGVLVLTLGQQPQWRERRTRETTELQPPFALETVEPKTRLHARYACLRLGTGAGEFDILVSPRDERLLRLALAPVEAHPSRTS